MKIDDKRARLRIDQAITVTELLSIRDRQKESSLMVSKWHDYRFMSPWNATMHFGKLYQKAYQATIRRCIDLSLSKNSQGVELVGIEKNRNGDLTSLWRARQRADLLGVRYEDYLEFCFTFAMNRNRNMLPRPNQLCYTEKSELPWALGLEELWFDRVNNFVVAPADLPQYRVENYRGLPAQNEMRSFALDLVKENGRPLRRVMRDYAVERPRIPIRSFLDLTDGDQFKRHLRSLRDERRARRLAREAAQPLTSDEFMQSCYGIPNARRPGEEPCSLCPQSAACQRMISAVLSRVRQKHGVEDPVDHARRAGQARRTAKSRAGKKAEATASNEASRSMPGPM